MELDELEQKVEFEQIVWSKYLKKDTEYTLIASSIPQIEAEKLVKEWEHKYLSHSKLDYSQEKSPLWVYFTTFDHFVIAIYDWYKNKPLDGFGRCYYYTQFLFLNKSNSIAFHPLILASNIRIAPPIPIEEYASLQRVKSSKPITPLQYQNQIKNIFKEAIKSKVITDSVRSDISKILLFSLNKTIFKTSHSAALLAMGLIPIEISLDAFLVIYIDNRDTQSLNVINKLDTKQSIDERYIGDSPGSLGFSVDYVDRLLNQEIEDDFASYRWLESVQVILNRIGSIAYRFSISDINKRDQFTLAAIEHCLNNKECNIEVDTEKDLWIYLKRACHLSVDQVLSHVRKALVDSSSDKTTLNSAMLIAILIETRKITTTSIQSKRIIDTLFNRGSRLLPVYQNQFLDCMAKFNWSEYWSSNKDQEDLLINTYIKYIAQESSSVFDAYFCSKIGINLDFARIKRYFEQPLVLADLSRPMTKKGHLDQLASLIIKVSSSEQIISVLSSFIDKLSRDAHITLASWFRIALWLIDHKSNDQVLNSTCITEISRDTEVLKNAFQWLEQTIPDPALLSSYVSMKSLNVLITAAYEWNFASFNFLETIYSKGALQEPFFDNLKLLINYPTKPSNQSNWEDKLSVTLEWILYHENDLSQNYLEISAEFVIDILYSVSNHFISARFFQPSVLKIESKFTDLIVRKIFDDSILFPRFASFMEPYLFQRSVVPLRVLAQKLINYIDEGEKNEVIRSILKVISRHYASTLDAVGTMPNQSSCGYIKVKLTDIVD